MKALTTIGLTQLINLIKSSFIKNTDVVETQSIEVYSKNEIDSKMVNKQDKLTPGTNIIIDENNVISATGGGADVEAYTASEVETLWETY